MDSINFAEEAFLECSSKWYNTLRKYSFATEGLGLFTVAVVGVLANFLSIAVLCQRTMKSQITALLITLAIFDILFLLCTMPVFTAQSVSEFVAYLNECVYPTGKLARFIAFSVINNFNPIELMGPKIMWSKFMFNDNRSLIKKGVERIAPRIRTSEGTF